MPSNQPETLKKKKKKKNEVHPGCMLTYEQKSIEWIHLV